MPLGPVHFAFLALGRETPPAAAVTLGGCHRALRGGAVYRGLPCSFSLMSLACWRVEEDDLACFDVMRVCCVVSDASFKQFAATASPTFDIEGAVPYEGARIF
jgi:hypothetical protein